MIDGLAPAQAHRVGPPRYFGPGCRSRWSRRHDRRRAGARNPRESKRAPRPGGFGTLGARQAAAATNRRDQRGL